MSETLIRNELVVAGTGQAPRKASVGIRDGQIVDPDSLGTDAQLIDADGRVVTPGFHQ